MVSILPALPPLLHCSMYCGMDHILGPVIVFIKPHPTASRVESHIFTCAGNESYHSLTINPASALYEPVNRLPQDRQNSEYYRGLAVTVMKYFSEMPSKLQYECQQHSLRNEMLGGGKYDTGSVLPVAFDESHAAELASRLQKTESERAINDLSIALGERSLSCMDMDVVVRGGGFSSAEGLPQHITRILNLLGSETTLPSTKLKRTTSRHGQHARQKSSVEYSSEMLEREVNELVETEMNYVSKIQILIDEVVEPIRKGASVAHPNGGFPSEQELVELFPACLDRILQANSDFATAVEKALEAEGTVGVAKCCLQYFPKFKGCYQAYLRASPSFPQLLNKFSKDKNSGFYKIVEQTGEQMLRSLLIEPVQRLPRYSLYIDNFLNFLDPSNPATTPFSLAREVISDICSLQSSDSAERTQTTKRLQAMIPSWPLNLKPSGRLITAVDFYEIMPPYNTKTSEYQASILLLFPDCVAILRRPNKATSLMARGIMAEVDRPSSMRTPSTSKKEGIDLVFAGWCDLGDLKFLEAEQGSAIWMTNLQDFRDGWEAKGGSEAGVKKLTLTNAYERRASRFLEEVVSARLESRCGSNQKGAVSIRLDEHAPLKIWSCIWGQEFEGWREVPRKSDCVVFLGERGSLEGALDGELDEGVEIVIGIEAYSEREVKLDIRTEAEELNSSEIISDSDFSWILIERLLNIIQKQHLPGYPSRTPILLNANGKLLRSMSVPYEGESRRKLRPPSPVKILSYITGGNNNTPARMGKPVLLTGDRTILPIPSPASSRSETPGAEQKITLINGDEDTYGLNIFRRLEKIMEAYLDALRTAIGDGAVELQQLERSQESLVDYANQAVTIDPSAIRDLPASVIYEAFVRFLRGEWAEKMGPLLGRQGFSNLSHAFDTYSKPEFEEYFMSFLTEMTPQNRRAFKNIMLLVHDMTLPFNISTRDKLLLAFTNILHSGNAAKDGLKYSTVVKHIASNVELLFTDTPHQLSLETTPFNEPGVRRANTVNVAGTVTTSSSATRKKFTLSSVYGSIRGDNYQPQLKEQRSGEETLGRVASVLRTLSKRTGHGEKSRLNASRSLDEDIRTVKRPTSRDRPTLMNAFTPKQPSPSLESILGSPAASNSASTTPVVTPAPAVRKKKRRSSLSDLKMARDPEVTEARSSADKRGSVLVSSVKTPQRLPELTKMSPFTFPKVLEDADYSPNQTPVRRGSSTLSELSVKLQDSPQTPSPPKRDLAPRERRERKESVSSTISSLSVEPRERKERKGSVSAEKRPTTSGSQTSTSSRSKIGSTRRAHDRFSYERSTLNRSDSSSTIGESGKTGAETSTIKRARAGSRPGSSAFSAVSAAADASNATQEQMRKEIADLRAKYQSLEGEVNASIGKKEDEIKALKADIKALNAKKEEEIKAATMKKDREIRSLSRHYKEAASESSKKDVLLAEKDVRLRELNRLFKDMNEEQDVLFERYNQELEQIAQAARGGSGGANSGEQDLFKLLSESKAEQGRLKREIGRLRRENVSLKAKIESTPG